MRIYGVDFTSAPRRGKPITVAVCDFAGGVLHVRDYERLGDFPQFEAFLAREGEWVAGLDFPFGQPRKLIDNLGWPQDWEDYVMLVDAMGKQAWVDTVKDYMALRPRGDKLHFRAADRLCNAQSPMKMSFVPVGRMFFQGAPRLAVSGANILPNRPTDDPRTVLEVYPALVARKLVGRGSKYKSDNRDQQTDMARRKREAVLDGLMAACEGLYGFSLDVPEARQAALVDDPTGDMLDTVLGAVQAAWGYTQRDRNYGIPVEVDPLEGWIVDPQLLESKGPNDG